MQFQQITGPVMAKSVEYTAFYIYNRLVSLNEVGGNPEQFGISLDDFHRHNLWHVEHWPHTMLGLSTHDTKRSEDVRARLNVLSEIPQEREAAIWRWSEMNLAAKTNSNGEFIPERNDEYLLYQSLVGAWPNDLQNMDDFQERISGYMRKATNEAKVRTSWTNPDEVYETALQHFIDKIFANELFMRDVQSFQSRIAYFGQFNSLSQTLLKLTSPGVTDAYQGNELWDFSLVDPDNRRPVDYEKRKSILTSIKAEAKQVPKKFLEQLLQNDEVGRMKLYLMHTMLQFRRTHRYLFDHGDYHPLMAEGRKSSHVCAFWRHYRGQVIIAVVPVLMAALCDYLQQPPVGDEIWHETWLQLSADLPGGEYRNLFTQEAVHVDNAGSLPLALVLSHFPVGVLYHGAT